MLRGKVPMAAHNDKFGMILDRLLKNIVYDEANVSHRFHVEPGCSLSREERENSNALSGV